MECYGAILVSLSLLQGFIVQGFPQDAIATEAESLEPGVHSDSPTVRWYYTYPSSGVVSPNGYPTGSYPVYPGGNYPANPVGGYPSIGGYPGFGVVYPGSEAGYPGTGGSYPGSGGYYPGSGGYYPGSGGAYPGSGGAYPGSGGSYPGSGGAYPGSGGSYPGSGGSYPGSGRSYPDSGRGIVPPTGTDNGKIPGGIPVSDDVEIFAVPGRGAYGR